MTKNQENQYSQFVLQNKRRNTQINNLPEYNQEDQSNVNQRNKFSLKSLRNIKVNNENIQKLSESNSSNNRISKPILTIPNSSANSTIQNIKLNNNEEKSLNSNMVNVGMININSSFNSLHENQPIDEIKSVINQIKLCKNISEVEIVLLEKFSDFISTF